MNLTNAILLVALTCLVGHLDALNCHSCDTDVIGQSDCGDPFSAGGKYSVQCPVEAQKYCAKGILGSRVARACVDSCPDGIHCCSSDNCNSSGNFKPNKLVAGIFLLVSTGLTMFKFL